MKKIIPIAKLQEEAKAKQVSVYLLVKRYLNYRKLGEKDHGKNCLNCKTVEKVHYESGDKHQCLWMGIIKDFYANVDEKHICNFHERSYKNKGAKNDNTI